MTKTILLIHGAWLNADSWAGFKARYGAKGYNVIAPSWPHDDRSPAELRAKPHPELVDVGFKRIIDHYEAIIRALPEQPIIIGHSVGGVFTQLLMDRGLGAAGVVINPAPTPGVPLGPHAIVSAAPVFLSWGSWGRAMQMTRKFFANRFAQTAPRSQTDALYDRYIVPTPGKVYWDGLLRGGKIDWASQKRPPMLLIGGGKDLIADASMTRAIFKRQQRAASTTELKIYPERSHWTCMDAGWEEVADFALDWTVRHARSNGGKVEPLRVAKAA